MKISPVQMNLPSLSSLRLVATDLDGTLLHTDHTISSYTNQILRRIQALGIMVVLISGRPLRTLRLFARDASVGNIIICSNGAITYDLNQDVFLQEYLLLPAQVKHVILLLRAFLPGIFFAVETGNAVLYESAYPDERRPHDTCKPRIGDVSLLWQQPRVKILAYHAQIALEELHRIVTLLLDSTLYSITYSGDAFLEIGSADAQKGTALASLCAGHGIKNQEAIAFGDMPNDLPLLQWAGYGVAVSNAHPLILQEADFVTLSNDEDGVACLLAQLLEPEPFL